MNDFKPGDLRYHTPTCAATVAHDPEECDCNHGVSPHPLSEEAEAASRENFVRLLSTSDNGQSVESCPVCSGKGHLWGYCERCGGTGEIPNSGQSVKAAAFAEAFKGHQYSQSAKDNARAWFDMGYDTAAKEREALRTLIREARAMAGSPSLGWVSWNGRVDELVGP